MNRITIEEFCMHIDDEDFFKRYGNPVIIINEGKDDLVCMTWECYERAFTEYWIIELEIPDRMENDLREIALNYDMNLEEFMSLTMKRFYEFIAEHPYDVEKWVANHSEQDEIVKVMRMYPVFFNETESEARERALAIEKVTLDE